MKDDINDKYRKSYDGCCCEVSGPKKNGDFWNNPITRRKFLKNTGGATAATVLALSGMKVEVLGQGAYSVTYLVKTYPASHYSESTTHSFEGCKFKVKKWNVPTSGIHSRMVTIQLAVEIWEDGAYSNREQTFTMHCQGILDFPWKDVIRVEPAYESWETDRLSLKTGSGGDTTLGFYELWSDIVASLDVTGWTEHSKDHYVVVGTFGAKVVHSERRYSSGAIVTEPSSSWAAPVSEPLSPLFGIRSIP